MPQSISDAIDVAYSLALASGAPDDLLDAIVRVEACEQARLRLAGQKRSYEVKARRLLGVQAPITLCERVKAAADKRGVSVYAWLMGAILDKLALSP